MVKRLAAFNRWHLTALWVLLLGGIWIGVSTPRDVSASLQDLQGPLVGHAAPHFRAAYLVSGEELHWNGQGNTPTVINFWASWCPPCRREIPALMDAFTRYGGDIEILGIVRASDSGPATAMAQELAINYRVAEAQAGDQAFEAYEILNLPTTFFVDRNGIIQLRHIGELTRAILAEGMSRILK